MSSIRKSESIAPLISKNSLARLYKFTDNSKGELINEIAADIATIEKSILKEPNLHLPRLPQIYHGSPSPSRHTFNSDKTPIILHKKSPDAVEPKP